MSWTCEISGESLGGTQDEIVVTPSGHICVKRLLLAKLAENGGMDPFETIRELQLSEDQLITLAASSTSSSLPSPAAPPRPQQASSLPNLLQLVQKEYDSLVLELFDTRRALEETRRELSQALYQNDAAVRVVARLAQERDAAQQELERWSASVSANGGVGAAGAVNGTAAAAPSTTTTNDTSTAKAPPADTDDTVAPETKRRRLDPSAGPLENDLPEVDWQTLQDTWEKSSAGRKVRLKEAAARAPTPETLAKYANLEQKAWHKSTNRGILCIARTALDGNEHGLIVTAGKDKQLVVYDEASQVVKHTLSFGSPATSVDISVGLVVAGDAKGKLAMFSLEGEEGYSSLGELKLGAAIVDVTVHPSQQHVLVTTANGRVHVMVCSAATKTTEQVAFFQRDGDVQDIYTCACLHPDGLIYAVGTSEGQVELWDLKNKVLAAILEGQKGDGLSAIAISNNGYQIAAAHYSATLRCWDLRTQNTLVTLKDMLESVESVAFDESGKYLASGGKGGVKITTVKGWDTTASISTKHPVSGIAWSQSTLELCSDKERAVHFYGVSES